MGSSFLESNPVIRLVKQIWLCVLLFLAILSFFLFHFIWQRREVSALSHYQQETLKEIQTLKCKTLRLKKAIHSLDDPDWVEREMIEKMGVVPKGYRAIVFDEGYD